MTKTITRKITTALLGAAFTLGGSSAFGQAFTEDFNDITTLAGSGWVQTNNSAAVGSTNWFQGNPVSAGGPFDAYNGATNAYIGANYNNTGNTGTISNFLITPNRTFRNGDVITFRTRKPSPDSYADRLEVRLSTNGASTAVGAAGTGVGDFTTLLLSVNPTLVLGVYPTVWTQYTITISGLPAPTSGRIAFRYFVTGAGLSGTNSDYIGIDNVVYTPYVCPAFTLTTGGALAGGTAGSAYSSTITQTGALGTPTFAITAGALPPGLTIGAASGTISGTPTATGTFNFTVTASDNSGCSGSQSYSITVVCPANPISFTAVPALCSNAAPLTLNSASPAGGTYSGTGVTGGQFNPAAGSQSVTYDYTDAYGCAFSASQNITVNTAPTASQSAVSAVCSNASPITLSGGAPAGGTYSGTGVSAGQFDPAAGTQTLTYTYTDANGCTDDVTFAVTVNAAPTVTQAAIPAVCSNASPITLTGGSPAGGSYSGNGVTAGQFDPSAGVQNLIYSYTDANGCTEQASFSVTINTAPTVTQSAVAAVCADAGPFVLSGGSPVSGTYSGTGVTAGSFNPSAGTQTLTYSFTDASGCTDTETFTVTVNPLPTPSITSVGTLCVYGAAVTLVATPTNGTFSGTGVTGTSFDPATAGVGSTTITYTYTDGNGCTNDATTSATVSACAGIDESAFAASVNVYPNPSDNGVNVTMNVENASNVTFKVYDMQGKLLVNQLVGSVQGQYTHWLDISSLAAGTYQLALESADGRVVKQIIKR